ncbi:MAG: helix-turn-helix transcriptional regulator [bacterium]|nr:helix-turn-helix transcriptional regulator [bacterium]
MKSNSGGSSRISDNVVEFILTRDSRDFETLNVSSIARVFKINRSYLSQRFKADKKFALHEYILKIKIMRSVSVLEIEEDITVDKLSKRMGFSSPDYFRRIFKERVGITPGKYKKCFRLANPLKMLDDDKDDDKDDYKNDYKGLPKVFLSSGA